MSNPARAEVLGGQTPDRGIDWLCHGSSPPFGRIVRQLERRVAAVPLLDEVVRGARVRWRSRIVKLVEHREGRVVRIRTVPALDPLDERLPAGVPQGEASLASEAAEALVLSSLNVVWTCLSSLLMCAPVDRGTGS